MGYYKILWENDKEFNAEHEQQIEFASGGKVLYTNTIILNVTYPIELKDAYLKLYDNPLEFKNRYKSNSILSQHP